MAALHWLSLLAGVGLTALVAADVFATILHPDLEGPIARVVQREVWRLAVLAGSRWRDQRRRLVAMAGPLMTVVTFAAWIGLFILGAALVFWPFLGSYRAEAALGRLTFLDALYFAGATVTVLGYGDLTPLTGPLKVLAFVASGTGFALFTGIVAYLIELVSAIDERNRLGLRTHDETGGGRWGSELPVRCLPREGVENLRERYDHWAASARTVHDTLHRYAQTSLYYRSRERIHDPEPALRLVCEAAIAGHLLSKDERWRGLAPAVEHLDLAVTRLLGTTAEQYLDDEVTAALASPSPTDQDRRYVEEVAGQLREGLGAAYVDHEVGQDDPALTLACRCRTCLSALDHLTRWSQDQDYPVPWDEGP